MTTAQQVADRLAELLASTQTTYIIEANNLVIQSGKRRRTIYLAPNEGQSRGVQAR